MIVCSLPIYLSTYIHTLIQLNYPRSLSDAEQITPPMNSLLKLFVKACLNRLLRNRGPRIPPQIKTGKVDSFVLLLIGIGGSRRLLRFESLLTDLNPTNTKVLRINPDKNIDTLRLIMHSYVLASLLQSTQILYIYLTTTSVNISYYGRKCYTLN